MSIHRHRKVELKTIVVLFLALIVTFLAGSLLSGTTGLLPRAKPLDTKESFIPTLPAVIIVTPNAALPTPICTVDEDSCVTCCALINGRKVCQDRSCPAVKPYRVE